VRWNRRSFAQQRRPGTPFFSCKKAGHEPTLTTVAVHRAGLRATREADLLDPFRERGGKASSIGLHPLDHASQPASPFPSRLSSRRSCRHGTRDFNTSWCGPRWARRRPLRLHHERLYLRPGDPSGGVARRSAAPESLGLVHTTRHFALGCRVSRNKACRDVANSAT
jgi:hypothetical protein